MNTLALLSMLAAAPLTFSTLPEPVRATVTRVHPDAAVTKIELETGGYEVKMTTAAGPTELAIAADGKLISEERSVSFASCPAEVKKAFAASAHKKLKVESVEEVTEGGVTTWEIAGIGADGKSVEVVITAKGEVTSHDATE